jgi:heptosyltransferase-2
MEILRRPVLRTERIIVVLKPRYLGDAVMATPILNRIVQEFERPTILAPEHIATMLHEDIGRFEVLAPCSPMLRQTSALRNFDTAILVNRSFRSALTTFLAGINIRVGHATESRGLLLSKRIEHDPARMEAKSYGDLLEAIGLPGDYSKVKLTATEAERAKGRNLLEGATIGLQPGARFEAKRIPTPAQIEVIEALHEAGATVALIGGEEESHFADPLPEGMTINLIGKTAIRQTMGVLAELDAMIGGSTGIMHIAAALGTPTVTAFGPTLPSRWGHPHPHISIQPESKLIADVDSSQIIDATLRIIQSGPIQNGDQLASVERCPPQKQKREA